MSVSVKYKNNSIAELSETGTKTLKTAGKYCEADIVVENTKDSAPPITGYYEANSVENDDGTQTLEITNGTSIVDGIIVKARDENGLATSIDVYGNEVYYRQFYGGSQYTASQFTGWNNVQTVNIVSATKIGDFGMGAMQQLQTIIGLENVQEIGGSAFFSSGTLGNGFDFFAPNCVLSGRNCFVDGGIMHAKFPNLTTIGNRTFGNCTKLQTAKLPKITQFGIYTSNMFAGCTALQSVEVGSIGYGVLGWGTANFSGCTQADLTVTMYTKGEKVDALLAAIRDGATSATIILKASEATEYNSTAFAAGETILTSTVEVTDE